MRKTVYYTVFHRRDQPEFAVEFMVVYPDGGQTLVIGYKTTELEAWRQEMSIDANLKYIPPHEWESFVANMNYWKD